jgi:hypothetical protein
MGAVPGTVTEVIVAVIELAVPMSRAAMGPFDGYPICSRELFDVEQGYHLLQLPIVCDRLTHLLRGAKMHISYPPGIEQAGRRG